MYRRLLKMLVTAKAQQDIPGLTRTCTESPPSHNLAHFSPCAQETYEQLLNPAWAANILTLKICTSCGSHLLCSTQQTRLGYPAKLLPSAYQLWLEVLLGETLSLA